MEAEFEEAKKVVESKVDSLSQEQMLKFYGLFKQALIGDCNIESPGFLYFRANAKWDAWNSMKGTNKENAMKLYIEESKKL